jgi:hypothetical protein
MPDPFLGVRLKLSRAKDQIDTLQGDMKRFMAENPCSGNLDFNTDSKILSLWISVSAQPDPIFGVVIGEIIHNLRSALDHIVWELVILTTGRPPALPSKNQFPIMKSKEDFNKRGVDVLLQCVREDAVDLIRSEQPFRTGEHAKSPLWHLSELSNADKHRTLHVTATLPHKFHVPGEFRAKFPGQVLEVRHEGPIVDKAVLWAARFPTATEWPIEPRYGIQCELTVDVAFDQRTPAVGGWLTIATLALILTRTDKIARRIAKEIFKTDLNLTYNGPVNPSFTPDQETPPA